MLLTYNHTAYDEDGNALVSIAANIRCDFLSSHYGSIQKGIIGDFTLINENNCFIANPDKRLISKSAEMYLPILKNIENTGKSKGSFQFKLDGKNMLIVYAVSANTNWKYIVTIPIIDMLGQIYDIQKYFVLVSVFIAILMIPVSYLIAGSLYKPLGKLVFAMNNIEKGNLDTSINDSRKDEYQEVFQGFNDMVKKLRGLIEDLSNEKISKKEAEINLLQAQINPHFLYNTLDSIYSISVVKNVDSISQLVSALSRFFRISLSGGKAEIFLKEEIDIINSYLTIQNIRFNNKIICDINIPEEYQNAIVPKLFLQPIVENAIYHGIEMKKGQGHLWINCSPTDAGLDMYVKDDGVGISEDKLELIQNSINNENGESADNKNFALKTLNKQLILKYGNFYGIKIESTLGEGTMVAISIPLIKELSCIK
jgi:two-component system sensor histidine kinase YesM